MALLSPDFSALAALEYEFVEVDLTHEGENFQIMAHTTEIGYDLTVKGVSRPLSVARFSLDPDAGNIKAIELENEHYREFAAANSSHPVMQVINRLPTPMFLGLDRRPRFTVDERRRFSPWRYPKAGRHAVGPAHSRSLIDAADLAATSNRDALIMTGRISDELRRELLLSLLSVSPEDYGNIVAPTSEEVAELGQIRKDLEAFPAIFKLPGDEVSLRVRPFLDALQSAADALPSGLNPQDVFSDSPPDQRLIAALVRWSANRSQLKRIRVISEVVAAYNERRRALQAPIQKYQALVNKFLCDSGKSIHFDEDGYIYVNVDGVVGRKDITSLSSGEAQIFVILSHLSFSGAASQANLFIVDEPELSLHVLWQEMFVDSVLEANPKIQYIMATHSPSVILDRTAYCVDISRKVKRKKENSRPADNEGFDFA
ncbi:AAA family ATPase [Brevundimonas nasdae]|uniref:AAA family ATPase n=1 Tax=Brevundimonas nasdae TaxID=172043 RepID=UPI00397778EE